MTSFKNYYMRCQILMSSFFRKQFLRFRRSKKKEMMNWSWSWSQFQKCIVMLCQSIMYGCEWFMWNWSNWIVERAAQMTVTCVMQKHGRIQMLKYKYNISLIRRENEFYFAFLLRFKILTKQLIMSLYLSILWPIDGVSHHI